MLPPPPVFAPPAGAAALDEVSGDGAVAAGLGAVGEAVTEALTDGDGAGVDGAGLEGAGLDGVGFGVGLPVQVGFGVGVVGVGVGVGVWQWHFDGDGDGDGLWPPPGCPLTPAADLGVACAVVAPSSSATTPRAKQPARIRMRMGMYVTLLIARSLSAVVSGR
jgi:hypothetical protein